MSKISDLMMKIEETTHFAEQDLSNWPWQTRPGMISRQHQAKEELGVQKLEYQKVLLGSSVKVVVDGDALKKEFVDLMKSEGAFVFSANHLYAELAAHIKPVVNFGHGLPPDALLKAKEITYLYARNFGARPLNDLTLPFGRAVTDFDDLIQVVKQSVRNAFGDSLNKYFLTNLYLEQGLKERFVKDLSLFVLVDLTNDEKGVLLDTLLTGQPNLLVELDSEVPKAVYEKIHKKAQNLLKKQTEPLSLKKLTTNEVTKEN